MNETLVRLTNVAVSEVAICNKALRYLGAAEIVSLAQKTREADLCNQGYGEARNELLAAHYWSFATRYATLAPLYAGEEGATNAALQVLAGTKGWSHAYRLPSDCLAVQRLLDGAAFAVAEGATLYTNACPAQAALSVLVKDPTRYPPLFIEALARRLAVSLAVALVNNARLEEAMMRRFQVAFETACLADAAQEGHLPNDGDALADPWIQAR